MKIGNNNIDKLTLVGATWAWAPFIFLIIAVAIANYLLGVIISCEPSTCNPFTPAIEILSNDARTPVGTFSELSGRIAWSISVLLFFLAIIVIYSVMLWNVFVTTRNPSLPMIMIVLVVVIAIIANRVEGFSDTFKFNSAFLDTSVYAVSSAYAFVDIIQILGITTLCGLAITLSILNWCASETVLRNDDVNRETDSADNIYQLAALQGRVKTLLYLAALVLVAGTIQTSTLYTWAVSMINNEGLVANSGAVELHYFDDLTKVPGTMSFLSGAFYSILLFSVFTPALVHLRVLSLKLARTNSEKITIQEQQTWLENNSLGGSATQQIFSILLMLSPIITGGPFAMLLELAS